VTGSEEATESDSSDATTLSVVVADDHPIWREAVARDLTDAGFNVVATADDGHSAVNRTLATRPDVLVLDLNLPGLRGDQVCAAIVKAQVPTKVLILSASAEQRDVLEAVKVGATGYLLKSAGRQELLDAVRATARGKAVFTAGRTGPCRTTSRTHSTSCSCTTASSSSALRSPGAWTLRPDSSQHRGGGVRSSPICHVANSRHCSERVTSVS